MGANKVKPGKAWSRSYARSPTPERLTLFCSTDAINSNFFLYMVMRQIRPACAILLLIRLRKKPFVSLLEGVYSVFHVVRSLFKGRRIPLTARRAKKIPAIHMDGSGDLVKRIGHGVDNGCAER